MALTRYIMSDGIPSLSAEQPPGRPPFAASFFFGFFFFSFLVPSLFYLRFFSLKRQKYPALSRSCDLPACLLARGMQNFCLSKKGWKERVDVEREKIERKGETIKRGVAFLEPNKNLLRFRLPLYSRSNDRPRKKRSLNSSFFAFSSAGNSPCSLFSR